MPTLPLCVCGVRGGDLKVRVEAILANRRLRELTRARIAALTLAMLTFVAAPVVVGALTPRPQAGPATAARPRFDVAAIRRAADPTARGATFAAMPGGTLRVVNNPIMNLITNAYGVPRYRTDGGPEWIRAEAWDIEARSERNPPRSEMMLMLQVLLEERFKLKVHRESREGPVYVLAVARGGPKLTASTDGGCVDRSPGKVLPPEEKRPNCGNNLMNVRGANIAWVATRINIAEIADALSAFTGRSVIEKTGLNGFYDINLELPRLAPEPVSDPTGSAVSAFTVIREQLGLTLEPGRGPIEMLVIDSIERPTEN